jgi:hypothetical protein
LNDWIPYVAEPRGDQGRNECPNVAKECTDADNENQGQNLDRQLMLLKEKNQKEQKPNRRPTYELPWLTGNSRDGSNVDARLKAFATLLMLYEKPPDSRLGESLHAEEVRQIIVVQFALRSKP